jgi:hypothetical protein
MRACVHSYLAFAVVASALAGCGSSSPGFSDGGSSGGVDSGFEAATSIHGSDSGFDAGSTSEVDASVDSGSMTGTDSGTPSDASGADGSTAAVCNFASGLNIAWVNFANDVPNPDIATFTTIFKATAAAGGRVIRWWFHTNGTVTPGYQTTGAQAGMAQNIPQSHIDGVKAILAAAAAQGVAVNISLWSFDMLQGSSEGISATTTTNNMNLLQVDANRQAYITNYLTPLVTALKGTPGLYSYEIFNEPEGMFPTGGYAMYRSTPAFIQTCVNQFAAAIHAADPDTPVTNGSQVFQYCSNVNSNTNLYSDTALRAAGGMQTGTLDFYEVHYYESNGPGNSCFLNPASHWNLDKKLVMGEFYAQTTDGVSQDNTYTYLYDAGYNGAWAWQYLNDDTLSDGGMTNTKWPAMEVPIQNLYTAEKATVGSCP